jgi:hypothetical protein
VVVLALGGLAAWWWFSALRAQAPAPPATVSTPRVIGQSQSAEEITEQEKEELQRILREGNAGGRRAE